jgi:hypothetical protein
MLHGKKETKAKDLGWLLHLAVLEPKRFEIEVDVAPKVDRRTKRGKELWAQFEAESAGKHITDADSYAKVQSMADSVMEHETAKQFFSGPGQNEISVVWDDKEHGVKCKARVDRISTINEWPIVGDLKSARNAARREFERSIFNYGYEVQAVHYLNGLEALYPVPEGNPFRRFVFIVVESEAPYLCAVYELDDAALSEGAIKRDRYIKTWKECVETGSWPGYAPGIDYVSLPPWAFKNFVQD